jgi:hypothetical protein
MVEVCGEELPQRRVELRFGGGSSPWLIKMVAAANRCSIVGGFNEEAA